MASATRHDILIICQCTCARPRHDQAVVAEPPSTRIAAMASTRRFASCRRPTRRAFALRSRRTRRSSASRCRATCATRRTCSSPGPTSWCTTRRSLDAVEDLIGPDILCWTTTFFIKEANSPGFVSWHQDSTYWGLDPDDVITAWVAFTEVDEANGYMQVIPGTPQDRPAAARRYLPQGQPAVARPGDRGRGRQGEGGGPRDAAPARCRCTTSSWCTARQPNRTNDRRIGLAIRYIPTYVRQTKVRDSAMLVRGVDTYGHFDHEPRPRRRPRRGGARRPCRLGRAPGEGALPGHREDGVSRLTRRTGRHGRRTQETRPSPTCVLQEGAARRS